MFDWKKFVVLAYLLIENGNEESIRSGISRLYYGFFGISRRYLINVKNKEYLRSKSGDIHFNVYTELLNSNDLTENEIAFILNKLRLIRNNADYDDCSRYGKEFFDNFLEANEKELVIAFEALEY